MSFLNFWVNLDRTKTKYVSYSQFYFFIVVVARTNGCMPFGQRSVWWIAVSDCHGWVFYEFDIQSTVWHSILSFLRKVFEFSFVLWFPEKQAGSRLLFWRKDISLDTIILTDTDVNNFSFTHYICLSIISQNTTDFVAIKRKREKDRKRERKREKGYN